MTRKAKARLLWAGLFLSALGLAAIWFLFQNREAELQTFAMGSYVRQTVWGGKSEQAAADASAALHDLENRISWRREGDVAQVNRQAGQRPVPVEPETLALLEQMRQLSEASGGAFDVTIGPVAQLWDFDSGPHLPEAGELEAALALVGYDRLLTGGDAFFELASVPQELFDGDAVALEQAAALLDPGMALDLGAVGKGAACDAALAQYQEAGVKGAVIAVGGSIGLYGQKPDGKAFRVSVRDPKGQGSMGVLELPGGFVSTSGSYEKYFEESGRRYHHLLDPRTGFPAESGLVSVTVWCGDSGALSDGLATACFVLGLEDSLALLDRYGAQGLFVDESGTVTLTPGWAERFTLTGEGYTIG